uniref:Uncharacterized protein n=1 Tax=Tanacetum cinerariifolium TaxID=118510 RepID=A0A699HN95_TANCI|nr:hypothetical protein [Tanacetum cinerariifolium]
MMTLGPSFDYYRTSECIVEGIIPNNAMAVLSKSMFWGELDRTIWKLPTNVGVMAIILVEFTVFRCISNSGQYFRRLNECFSHFLIGEDFSRALYEILQDSWVRLLIGVVPISPFFMLLSRAFSWSPLLRFFSRVTIYESDWSAFRSYFLCLQPRVYFLHESIVSFRKLRGYEVYQIFYFESVYEACYSLVFIEPVISGVSSVYLVIKPQTLSPSYLLMELIARVGGWSDELHAHGLCEHSWLPMVTGFFSSFLFLVRFRGVVICGLPLTSLSSSPVVTLADIMSVDDEGPIGCATIHTMSCTFLVRACCEGNKLGYFKAWV